MDVIHALAPLPVFGTRLRYGSEGGGRGAHARSVPSQCLCDFRVEPLLGDPRPAPPGHTPPVTGVCLLLSPPGV
jgi:hypothetical protein